MSGGSRSESLNPKIGGGGNSGSGNSLDCNSLQEKNILNSVIMSVVRPLKAGDVLTLERREEGNSIKIMASFRGKEAGSIIPKQREEFLKCMGRGIRYVAEVLENNNGAVTVMVRADRV